MTRSDLILKLAARYPQLLGKDAELAVKVILDSMATTLSSGDRIEVRGFGSFALNYRPPREIFIAYISNICCAQKFHRALSLLEF